LSLSLPSDSDRLRSLTDDELKAEITELVSGVVAGLNRLDHQLLRQQLLPALTLLRRRLQRGEWQNFLQTIRLNPATVRSWRARELATTRSVLSLLGEPLTTRRRKAREEVPESVWRELAEAGKRLAKSVAAEADVRYTRRLARELLAAFKGF
jgi:hypothetical protein